MRRSGWRSYGWSRWRSGLRRSWRSATTAMSYPSCKTSPPPIRCASATGAGDARPVPQRPANRSTGHIRRCTRMAARGAGARSRQRAARAAAARPGTRPDAGGRARRRGTIDRVAGGAECAPGRERELSELSDLLARDDVRLLVLTGAGGSGKTRLALEVARVTAASFANGAAFVQLAPLSDSTLVPGAIARALAIREVPGRGGAGYAGDGASRAGAAARARYRRAPARWGTDLQRAARRAPRITLLVTSRAVLHLSGEHVYPVQPLAEEPAVALFHQRSREADPSFAPQPADEHAIRRICVRLDGLPLAIELAAARTRILTPRELLERLDPRLPLLTGGPRDLPAASRRSARRSSGASTCSQRGDAAVRPAGRVRRQLRPRGRGGRVRRRPRRVDGAARAELAGANRGPPLLIPGHDPRVRARAAGGVTRGGRGPSATPHVLSRARGERRHRRHPARFRKGASRHRDRGAGQRWLRRSPGRSRAVRSRWGWSSRSRWNVSG